jgi:hypothetical protein
MGARGRVGRSCLGWRAPLEKHRWHCLVEREENTPLRALEAVTEFDMVSCFYEKKKKSSEAHVKAINYVDLHLSIITSSKNAWSGLLPGFRAGPP